MIGEPFNLSRPSDLGVIADGEALASKLADDFHEDYPRALRNLWTVWRRIPDAYEQAVQREASSVLLLWSTSSERTAWLRWWRQHGAVTSLAASMAAHHLWQHNRREGAQERAA
jgi:hypothetical protein